jgi:hypothetical protein
MKRLINAFAALAIVAVVLLTGGAPAHAESGSCTATEWANPTNFARCTAQLGVDLGHLATCLQPPAPDAPDSGVAGWVVARPESDLHDGVSGRYSRYGVAGYQLSLYDVTCVVGQPTDVSAQIGNTMGDWSFTAAAAILGASNRLRETAYAPGGMWTFSDGFVSDMSSQVFHHVFTVYGAIALAVLGLALLWRARAGSMSEALSLAGWSLFVMSVVTAVCLMPLITVHGADKVAATGLTTMHSVLGPAAQTIPADQCVDPNPSACVDNRTAATRASDVAVEAILYRNWLRAEFGQADSATASKFGPALYDAQTLTWDEAATINAHPEARQSIFDQKSRQWAGVAAQIKSEDPAAYENLRGKRGSTRFFTGLMTLLSALLFSGFDLAMSLVILLGFLAFRWSLVILPLSGTLGLIDYTSAWFRKTINAVVSGAASIIIAGAMSGAYLTVACRIFESSMSGFMQTVCVALVAAAGVAMTWRFRGLANLPGWRKSDKTLRKQAGHGVKWAVRHVDDIKNGAQTTADRVASVVAGIHGTPGPEVRQQPTHPRPETTAGRRP